ncbi:MAG: HD domain-containing protein [Acidobacteria bacterium]|nr:HD domain-containing protein [Acidobacteriota bacterium]
MKKPPRLVARTLAVTFITVAIILLVVFTVLTVDARDRVRASEIEKLRVAEQVFTALEARRQQEQLATIATLAENPTLKAALDTYFTERRFAGMPPDQEASLRETVAVEAGKLAVLTRADVLAILDPAGRVFVSAGPARGQWPRDERVSIPPGPATFQDVVVLPQGAFRVSGAALRLVDRDIGALVVGTSLDDRYAAELGSLASAAIVIAVNDAVVASTLPQTVTADLGAAAQTEGTRMLVGEEYAIRLLMQSGPVRILTLASIDAAARSATRAALMALGTVAFGAFVLAALGSLWLARTLTDPIDRLSREIGIMTAARDFGRLLRPTGTSREMDALAQAFNHLVQGLSAAEADTRAAYVGAIRALAAALDARDPYTAGHSDRVSALAVRIGREMRMRDDDLDVLRLGALLHDIGKIGLRDDVLRKPGALTAEEFEQIKRHPALGARILRQVAFLAPHLPIVELHHERPDGQGYPFGLRGDDIPLPARIVHVADAFDAMTSARAYRPARGAAEALAELQRYAGTQFDPASVDALVATAPALADSEPALEELLGRQLV